MNESTLKKRHVVLSLIIFFAMSCFNNLQAANENTKEKVSGIITDSRTNDPLIGVSVVEKGTTNGTITDLDGKYSINVSQNSILEIKYIGYKSVEVRVTKSELNVGLQEDNELLDEVVVIGYGVQKKSVTTAAISGVKAEELGKVSPTRVDNVLRGMVSGVNITAASGQPGDAARVRIRGIGTINDSDPLYVVDGMPIDKGGIDYLNPSDIESVEVLKDAASAAIYGSRGANGVILVSTKQGKSGKAVVNYNFSYGWQNPWKKRAVLDASQYAMMMNEMSLNDGGGIVYQNPQSYGKGTDWQDETFNSNAPIVQHQLSISGGNDKGSYMMSFGYFSQDGIVGGNYGRSNYDRYSLRLNNNYTIFDEKQTRNFLTTLRIGTSISYARIKSTGIGTNSEFGSPLGSALAISPMIGVYAEDPDATLAQYPTAVTNKHGQVYTIVGDDYNEITNPLAQLSLPGERNNTDKIVANFWAELEIYKNLKFKSSYGADLAFWGADGYTPIYYLGKSNNVSETKVWSSMNRSYTWQVENTLSYTNTINDLHNFTILLGQSAKKDRYRNLKGESYDLINASQGMANIDASNQAEAQRRAWGRMYPYHNLASYFGRISYNFDERYMLEATLRRDGSSNFGPNHKWGSFPSLSAGWNITNEKFMKVDPKILTSLKLRASWGKNGNESIDRFRYISMIQNGNNYMLGQDGSIIIAPGAKPNGYANPDIKWEQSEQTDIGVDARFLNGALSFTADWFSKKTIGMLMAMSLPGYIGDTAPIGNVGDMKNEGVEFDVSYQFKVSDFNFRVGANASYIKNKLTKLGTLNGWANYDSFQSAGTITRAANGEPFPFFYGKKTSGIFQTQEEVNSYVNSKGELLQPNAVPGDVRFVDINGDGIINDDDRTKIGKGMPDWYYGFNFNITWKGFDMNAIFQGTFGNDIFDATRRIDLYKVNMPSYMLDRWTGPGSSNRLPRLTSKDNNGNWQSSDLYVHNGSFLRLRSLQIGYTLPKSILQKIYLQNLRVFLNAENLLTFTSYEGFDPEISSGSSTSLGVDKGVYPQSRTISIGANIVF